MPAPGDVVSLPGGGVGRVVCALSERPDTAVRLQALEALTYRGVARVKPNGDPAGRWAPLPGCGESPVPGDSVLFARPVGAGADARVESTGARVLASHPRRGGAPLLDVTVLVPSGGEMTVEPERAIGPGSEVLPGWTWPTSPA